MHHLASVETTKADSASIYSAVCDLFTRHNLPWSNLVSIVSDSCAVIRGHVSGVEKRIRDEKATHLLDIDGDSCHHLQITAKKLRETFVDHLKFLFSSLYADFKWCSEYKFYLTSPTHYPKCTREQDGCLDMTGPWKLFACWMHSKFSTLLSYQLERTEMLTTQPSNKFWTSMEWMQKEKKTCLQNNAALVRRKNPPSRHFFIAREIEPELEFFTSVLPIFKEYVCLFFKLRLQWHTNCMIFSLIHLKNSYLAYAPI